MACDAGDALSCGRLGNMLMRGDGVAKDLRRAEVHEARACSLGLAVSCANWGALISSRAPEQAFKAYARGCDGGDKVSCFDEGYALATGQGVAKDPARAAKFFLSSCDEGHPPACNLAARAYLMGEGLPKDEAKAAPLLARACDGDLSTLAQADGTPLPPMAEACAAAATLLAPSANGCASEN